MRKLAWFSFSFGGAVALYVGLLNSTWGFCLGAGLLVAFLVLLAIKRGWSRLSLIALGLAAGLLWTAGYDVLHITPIQAMEGQNVTIEALLRDDPQPTRYGSRVYADAKVSGRNCRLLIYLDDFPEVQAGSRLQLTATLAAPQGEDYDLYYRANGVNLIAYARPGETVLPAQGLTLRTLPLLLRRAFQNKIDALFPADTAPFVQALLTGDRSGLSYGVSNSLSVSGIAHTVAISGMHVAILVGFVMLLCGNRPELTALIGIPIIILFTLMVGAMPSVVRAATMQILLLLAPLLRRENDPATSLGAAMLVILIPNPWAVANIGFQLSFGAMMGILVLSGRVYHRLSRHDLLQRALRHRLLRRPVHYVLCTIASTLGACAFTIPLVAWQFGMVSLISPLTNLLTLWAVTLVFEGALVLCLIGFIWAWPVRLLAGVLSWLIRYILAVAALMTRLPQSAVYTDNVYILLWLTFVYLAAVCCFLPSGRKLWLPWGCISALTLCLCLWLGHLDGQATSLDLTMLDVGQGQCLVFSSGNVTAIYDCGGSGGEQAGEIAARFLLSKNRTRLQLLILSHYDEDHAGGVCQLIDRLTVELLYLPDIPCDTGLRETIERKAAQKGVEVRYVTEDVQISFQDSTLRVFAPMTMASENDASVGLLYSQGSYDILATGDMTAAAERLLLSHKDLPDLEVLVAGHHGAATSTCHTLLELGRPETVLISVGEHNSYGHPAEDTLLRIAQSGAQIYRTDQCGTITIRR